MGKWGSENFTVGISPIAASPSLEAAVKQLNPKAKQAMYAASQKGKIAKKTWNGCAFNAGGKEVEPGLHISSMGVAAQVFDLEYQVVRNFIQAWDSSSETTEDLKEILVKVGLYTEPNENKPKMAPRKKRAPLVVRTYTSWETRMKEELDFNIEQDILPEGTEEAHELIFAGV